MPLTMPPPSRMSSQGSRVPSQRQPPAYRAALHAVAIISSKPALPAELLAHVLDFLPVPALLRAARVSRRMRDMVYEDSRWVAKLRAMGAWDEAEAQRWAGQAGSARRRTTITARRETEAGGRKDNATTGDASEDAAAGTHDARSALDVLARVQSVRGLARQEFGRVYAALGPLYADMARAQGPADAAVFRAFRGPEAQARALAALARFARSDEAAGRGTRARHLAAVTADFESAVLGEFARGCADGDVDGRMRRHAHVLVLLNGGGTGVECFAASAVGALPVREARECVRGVADGHVDLGPARGFFAEVGAAQAGHAGVVARVFPAGVDALAAVQARVCAERIAPYLAALLDAARACGAESYVKAVAGTVPLCLGFAAGLQAAPGSPAEFDTREKERVLRCYGAHLEAYVGEELAHFRTRAAAEVALWETERSQRDAGADALFASHMHRQAAKRDFLTSFKKAVMLPVAAVSAPFAPAPARALDDAPRAAMDSPLDALQSQCSIDVALRLTQLAQASLARAAAVRAVGGVRGAAARDLGVRVFVALLDALGDGHVARGFDRAIAQLARYRAAPSGDGDAGASGRVEPLVAFLELVHVGDVMQQMVEVVWGREVVGAGLVGGDDFAHAGARRKKRFEEMLDGRVADGLHAGLEALVRCVGAQLAAQPAADYAPAPGRVPSTDPTRTARAVCALLARHAALLPGAADAALLEVFRAELGARVFGAVCAHVRRARVTVSGAVAVLADVAAYGEVVGSGLGQRGLARGEFAALRAVAALFLVEIGEGPGRRRGAADLAAIVADTGRYGGVFTAEEVLEFAGRRADWEVVQGEVERALFGVGCGVM